jgi:glyoxylase-like metal-dependent hydrolase (beta-lactamase superfamily II)
MTKRKILDVEAREYVDFDEFDMKTPEEVIERMKALRASIGDRDVYFYISHYGYDGGKELTLRERREETDKEYEKRIADEKKVKAKAKETKALKEAKEFAEFQRLKKKFESAK